MRKFKFILGYTITLLFPLNILTVELGTCTQGSTDSFTISAFYSIFIVLIFLVLAYKNIKDLSKFWWFGLYHIISIISVIIILPKYIYFTAIRGISPCIVSNDFQTITDGTYSTHAWQTNVSLLDRLFAPILIISLIALILYFWAMFKHRPKKKNVT